MRLKTENQKQETLGSYSHPAATDSRQEYKAQECTYLSEVREAIKGLSKSQYIEQGKEGRQQFAVGQVLRGEGRAVYSIKDKGALILELNQAFGLGNDKHFSQNLLVNLKSFQAEMVRNNPDWKKVEKDLNQKAKTLVDGLVGPLTIRALVSEGLLVVEPDGRLAAAAGKNNRSEYVEKAIEKDTTPKKDEHPQKEKSIISNPQVAKLQVDLMKTLEIVAETNCNAASLRAKTESELENFEECRTEVRLPSGDGSPFKYLTMFSEFNLIESNLKYAVDNLIELKSDLERGVATEAILHGEYTKLERLLLKESQANDSGRQRKLCKFISSKIATLCQEGRRYSQDIKDYSEQFDRSVSFYTEDLKKVKELPKKEASVRAKIAAGDLNEAESYVKTIMPADFDKDSSPYWRSISIETFAKSFNHGSSKSLELYQEAIAPSRETEGRRRPLGFGMLFSGNYEAFVSNLETESGNVTNNLTDEQRLDIRKYLSALSICKDMGIENPFRFSATTLIEIVKERRSPQLEKPLLVITAARSDHNGALYNLDNVAERFLQQGYRIQYHECSVDTDFVKSLELATLGGGKARAVCISGHGNQTSISLSNPDPRFHGITDLNRSIDLQDMKKLAPAAQYIEDQACIIVNSCSTGQGGKLNSGQINNIANFLRAIVPQAAEGFILAPVAPSNITEIDFNSSKRVQDVETKNRKDERVPNYQANNSQRQHSDPSGVA